MINDYTSYTDNELYALICEENEDAKEVLLNKYKYIIDLIVKKYSNRARIIGIEYNDLYQEALLGFSDALVCFVEDKSSLATFISLCVERRLQKVVSRSSRPKHRLMLESLSLDYLYEEFNTELKDVISDGGKNDPLNNIESEERFNQLLNRIKIRLSSSEYDVYELLINGFSYQDIAKILNKTEKSVDNTIQRLKNKIRQILKEME